MAAAVLLGNLRDDVEARLGLAIVVRGAAIIAYNNPEHAAGEYILVPALFAIGWLAGRAARASRAGRSGGGPRPRPSASGTPRPASLSPRSARIARELNDIVAHAVSVIVLQVGAVRHRLPDALAPDREALQDVERTGRTALTEMRRLLGAMRRGRRRDRSGAPARPRRGRVAARRGPPRGPAGGPPTSRGAAPAAARDRPLRVPDRPGGSDQRAQARPRQPRGRDGPLRAGRGADRGARRRRGGVDGQ